MADTSLIFNIIARDHATGTMDKVKARAKILGAAVGLLALKFGKDSVKAYVEAEQSQNRLQAAFAKFPGLADTNITKLQALNTSLAQKTKFDDDATASGQAVLAQFKLTGTQIEQLTPLLQDYAAKTGKDLPTAASDLGKAVLGQGRSLKAVGLNFKDTGTQAGNLDEIMGGLRQQVGGFATQQGKTAAGQAAILGNQFGELQEDVGAQLVPALVKLAGVLLSVIGFISRNESVMGPLLVTLGSIVGVIWLVNKALKAWTVIQGVLNVVLSANPIGLVILAIAALVVGIIIAYKKSETFRKIVDAAFKGIAKTVSWMWDSVIKPVFKLWINMWFTVVGAILHGAAKAFGWVPGIGGKLKSAADKFDQFRDRVNRSLDGVHDLNVTTSIKGGDAAIAKIAALRWQIDHIPRSVTVGVLNKVQTMPTRASGGPTMARVTYLVGERGPELFTPNQPGYVHSAPETRRMTTPTSPTGRRAGSNIVRLHPDDLRELGRILVAGINAPAVRADRLVRGG